LVKATIPTSASKSVKTLNEDYRNTHFSYSYLFRSFFAQKTTIWYKSDSTMVNQTGRKSERLELQIIRSFLVQIFVINQQEKTVN
jgi:hypothetical protein